MVHQFRMILKKLNLLNRYTYFRIYLRYLRERIYRSKIISSIYRNSSGLNHVSLINIQVQKTLFVNTRGLKYSCSIQNKIDLSSSSHIDFKIPKIRSTPSKILSIYIPTEATSRFVRSILPKISEEFILVTGDSDLSLNTNTMKTEINEILRNRNLILWLAQNCQIEHQKIISVPIGIDLHSMYSPKKDIENQIRYPLNHEESLIKILKQSPTTSDRVLKAYCNWHFQIDRGNREECRNQSPAHLLYYEPHLVPRLESYRKQTKFTHVLSPTGVGLDCVRTYEAIILGCIPIVLTSGLDRMYQKLPILILNKWTDLSEEKLMGSIEESATKKYDFSILMLDYWKSIVTLNKGYSLPLMNFNEFRLFIESTIPRKEVSEINS